MAKKQNQQQAQNEFEIEHDVPVPEQKPKKFPLDDMAVGDSFKFPATNAWRTRVNTACRKNSQKTGKKFMTRKVDEEHSRCWRVE